MSRFLFRRTAALFVGVVSGAQAYDLSGPSWAAGDIIMHLQLGQPASALMDGSADWAAVAESALNEWNSHLTRSRFTVVRNSTATIARRNGVNNVAFRADIYGSAFGERVLAVSLGSVNSQGRWSEQDVLFNSALTWNSYRGPLRSGLREFRRTALHEFGHVLGLDHPDEASPVQNVQAIMNSTVSSGTESLQSDDITGVKLLYDANSGTAPSIAAHPQSKTVLVGGEYTMAVTVNGNGPFTYTWAFIPPGSSSPQPFRLATGPSYTIGSVQTGDAGRYTVAVTSPGSPPVVSNFATLTVTPVDTTTDTILANISTRGVVSSGNSVLIAGLVINGTTSKNVLVRAVGPGLSAFGVGGALADPTLTIVDNNSRTVAQNDNWETGANAAAVSAASTRLGAFDFRAGSRDAAILTTLPPGNYTAIVSGVNNASGVALVEAYDADPDAATARTRKLVNIATRGQVNSGDNVLIAGLVVTGPGPRTYLIRAIGPTLARAPFNVSGALTDPFLQIYQGETLLRENDDWDSPPSGMASLREASAKVGAFAMMETRDVATQSGLDSAMLITLQPGSYTAKVSGFENRTGVALVEIYEMP